MPMTTQTGVFQPVRGYDEYIADLEITPLHEGYVYFATDTGKIYIDTATERVACSGGAAIIYASASLVSELTDGTYRMLAEDLDDSRAIPKANDLILNSDGRFFKVIRFTATTPEQPGYLICSLIAVSGTGGGGGSGGGGGDVPADDPKKINIVWHDVAFSFVSGTPYSIDFTATSQVDRYLTVEYEVKDGSQSTVLKGSKQFKSGERQSIEVGEKMSTSGSNAVYFTISGANSKTETKSFKNIKSIDFRLEQDNEKFTNYQIYDSAFTYFVNAYGAVAKTLQVTIDDTALSPIDLEDKDYLGKDIDIKCAELGLLPGVHTISAKLIANGIASNEIITDFIYHPEGTPDATYVLVTEYPQSAYSYDTPVIKYWVWDTAKTSGSTNNIELRINNVLVETAMKAQETDVALTWPISNTFLVEGINQLSIKCGAGQRNFDITVIESDIFNPTDGAVALMLSTAGRSNDTSLERRLQWEYTHDNKTIAARLNNFNWYNNGWKLDENNRSCLRISNGANVEIPLTLFTDSQPTKGGFTIEFEFKPYNLFSYQLLTTSASTSGEDEEVVVSREFDASRATISYVQGEKEGAYGFCLGTQDAYFRLSDGTNVTARYKDEEIMNIAMVINAAQAQMFIYVNGVMSGMTSYTRASGSFPLLANTIKIVSDFCDLDLYNIRIYSKALTSAEVVQNYISSKKDMNLYKANAISSNNTINLNELIAYNANNPSNTTIPYAIITTSAGDDILPFNKDNDDVIVDIEFVNPSLDYQFSLGKYTEAEYKQKAPSFKATKVKLNVQGTSSQKYPRKNFKAKFFKSGGTVVCTNEKIENKSLSKICLDSNIGEKTFTWKADYMDSSGTHNTGFTSFVKLLYDKHPLDYYEGTDGIYHEKYRTTIYGFPMLVFHKNSNGEVEFIGRYNFNLDKGCDDTLGFTDEGTNKILNKSYEDISECWEFGNNQGGRCSFKGAAFDSGYDYNTKTGKLNIADDLEVRYHKNKDAIEQAFDNLAEDEKTPITDEQAFNILLGGTGAGNHPNGYGNLERLFLWLQSVNFLFDLTNAEDQKYLQTVLERSDNIQDTDEDYLALIEARKIRFKDEFEKHFNLDYCLVYYIMTELLIQYDSRGKNMMLGSWGPMEEYWKDKDGNFILDAEGQKIPGEYIWFPIYYDVDTQLGVDNSGVPSWEYNVEPSKEKHFSTSNSILWTCFDKVYAERIQQEYVRLRGGNLTIDKLDGYYNFDPKVSNSEAMSGILPISFINADQYYKYIAPAVTGYIGFDKNNKVATLYSSGYYYCLQGTRDLHRALFLRNRFNYYDSMWHAGAYNPSTPGAAMRTRITEYLDRGNLNTFESVTLTPQLDQYVSVWLDESASKMVTEKATAGVPVTLNFDPDSTLTGYDKQLLYFGGPGYLSDFGDLSLLYINELDSSAGFPTSAVTSIILGNEDAAYHNDNLMIGHVQAINGKTQDGVLTSPKTLLKNFDLTNLSKVEGTLTIDTAEKLEAFKALGTNLTAVQFAPGVALNRLYLPNSTNKLELIEAANLNKIVYNKSDILDENGEQKKEGLFIENLVHLHPEANINVTRMNTVKLIGGALETYSYDLLSKLVSAKLNIHNHNSTLAGYTDQLALHLEQVHWTPYIKLGEGANHDATKQYVYARNDFTFTPYSYTTTSQWEKDISEGKVYEVSVTAHTINDLSLLDTFIENNYFTNITTTLDVTLPVLTGELYVNNSEPISEAKIANYYNVKFPGLDIKANAITPAYRARFVHMDGNKEIELVSKRYDKDGSDLTIVPPATTDIALPSHHDFAGWKLRGTNAIYKTAADFEDLLFSESNAEYVFELQYTKHVYTMTFIDEASGYNETVPVTYDEFITTPSLLPWRKEEEQALDLETKIAFKGWTAIRANAGNMSSILAENSIQNITAIKADKDMTFYAIFTEESVYDSIADEKYFKFENVTITIGAETHSGVYIQLAQEGLRGKVTLPTMTSTGQKIIAIGNFVSVKNEITHIFFDRNKENYILQIYGDAFKQSKLKYFNFNQMIKLHTIQTGAFKECKSMTNTSFGSSVKVIRNGAFNQYALDSLAVLNLTLPASLTTLETNTFHNCCDFGSITIGAEGEPSNLQWDTTMAAAVTNGNQKKNVSSITIYCTQDRAEDFDLYLREGMINQEANPSISIVVTQ